MTTTLPTRAQPRRTWRTLWFMVLVVLVGAVGAAAWAMFAHRPGYTVTEELGAYLSERGQADVFSSDALFVALAALAGVLLGTLTWLRFRDLGWLMCIYALVGGAVSGILIWQLGMLFSPDNFDQRLAEAMAGDTVPIDLALRSPAALLIGPFGAITPIMLFAALWPERESTGRHAPEARRVAAVE